jgi:hypothetical protein
VKGLDPKSPRAEWQKSGFDIAVPERALNKILPAETKDILKQVGSSQTPFK